MLVSVPVLNLPWYAPPRVFATMVMGRAALEFMVLHLELCLLPSLYGSAYNLISWTVIEIIQQWMDAGAPENRN